MMLSAHRSLCHSVQSRHCSIPAPQRRQQTLFSTTCGVATFHRATASASLSEVKPLKSFGVLPPALPATSIPEIGQNEYSTFISSEGLSLVTFSTPWCGPCHLVGKELETLTKVFKKVRFAKVDLSKQDSSFAVNQRIKALPTLRVYKNGMFMEELTGVKPVQMRQMLLHHSL